MDNEPKNKTPEEIARKTQEAWDRAQYEREHGHSYNPNATPAKPAGPIAVALFIIFVLWALGILHF